MASKLSPASQYIKELVAKFPDAPAMTLAKKAYREHPEYWKDVEACRSTVRKELGVMGQEHRRTSTDKTHFREPRKAGWTDVIPEALTQLDKWEAYEIPGPHRTLILSDIHIPHHDPQALEIALDYGLKKNPTLVILNGDCMDHYALSDFEKDPRQRDFPAEVRAGKYFLKGLRKRFPKARLLFKAGNHEERLDRYLRLKAPDLLGIPEFEWEAIFGLTEQKIEYIKDKRPIRLGKLNVMHGHEWPTGISSPVNPARGFFLRAKTHVLGGHYHQASQHSERSLEQTVVSAWSTGCLCDLHPAYRRINSWGLGFAFVETDKAGAFQVENLRIINGKIY